MASAEFSNVFPYREEVVVELAVRDPQREVEIRSFQFEYCDETTVRPKGGGLGEYRVDVAEALADEGFALAE